MVDMYLWGETISATNYKDDGGRFRRYGHQLSSRDISGRIKDIRKGTNRDYVVVVDDRNVLCYYTKSSYRSWDDIVVYFNMPS